jgi:hypothetical protein
MLSRQRLKVESREICRYVTDEGFRRWIPFPREVTGSQHGDRSRQSRAKEAIPRRMEIVVQPVIQGFGDLGPSVSEQSYQQSRASMAATRYRHAVHVHSGVA